MAIGQTELQITWDTGSDSGALNTANTWEKTSDEMTMGTSTIKAMIEMKGDQTAGTPASGDLVTFYAQLTLGDPDGAGSDEYDTDGHDIYLGQLDINTDNPAIMTVEFPIPCKGFRIRAKGAGFATTDVLTASCTLYQLTA